MCVVNSHADGLIESAVKNSHWYLIVTKNLRFLRINFGDMEYVEEICSSSSVINICCQMQLGSYLCLVGIYNNIRE